MESSYRIQVIIEFAIRTWTLPIGQGGDGLEGEDDAVVGEAANTDGVVDRVGLSDLKICPLNVKLIKAVLQGFNMIWYLDLSSKLPPS